MKKILDKFKASYLNEAEGLKTKNDEITGCINEKYNRIGKLETLRKEVIKEFSPVLEQKINTGYENFIVEDTKAKAKTKIKK